MAQGDALERLSKQPRGKKIVMLVAVVAAFGLGYWFFFYADMATEERAILGSITRDKKKAEELRDKRKKYDDLLKKKREIEGELAQNAVRLPSSAELPAFFVHLQAQATAANVRLAKWTRADEVMVETYVKVPVAVEVRGSFHQILEYFKLLYETPRIITVEDLTIGDGKVEGDRLMLSAKFQASTFREADKPPETAPQQGEAPAKGQKTDKAAPGEGPGERKEAGKGKQSPNATPSATPSATRKDQGK